MHEQMPTNFQSRMDEARECLSRGEYARARSCYDQAISIERDSGALTNRGLLYLFFGQGNNAWKDLTEVRETADEPISLPEVGVALWVAERRTEACADWAEEIRRHRDGLIVYTDEGGGVQPPAFLWWASAHPELSSWREIAVKELEQIVSEALNEHGYLFAVAQFLLGNIEPGQLLRKAATKYKQAERQQLCQAHFHLAARCIDDRDVITYRQHLEQACSYGDLLFCPQYLLARNILFARHE
jgi:tetratricopeptide (TPR) repeat protein